MQLAPEAFRPSDRGNDGAGLRWRLGRAENPLVEIEPAGAVGPRVQIAARRRHVSVPELRRRSAAVERVATMGVAQCLSGLETDHSLTGNSGGCRSRGSASGGTPALGTCRLLGARGAELHTLAVHDGPQGRLAEKRLAERAVDPQLDAPPHIDGEPERAVLALGAEKYDHGIVVRRDALQHEAVAVSVADRYRLLRQHSEGIVRTGRNEQQS